MLKADFLIIGGGIAGVSAAARLALHGHVVLLEAESSFGYHSSGRSATFYHFGIGNTVVRGLTAYSRDFFESETDDGVPLSHATPALFIARPEMLDAAAALEAEMQRFTNAIERVDEQSIRAFNPAVRCGDDAIVAGVIDHSARRLDSEALQQGCRATIKRHGGACVAGARARAIERNGGTWNVTTDTGDRYAAPVLINAAGAWCDEIAALAGVKPLGVQPLRRTIIAFDPPPDQAIAKWPFTKTVVDDFYMLPQSGKLLASPVDEVLSVPTDAQPEDYDIALAAAKVEEYTVLPVRHIQHSWAGLRTFVRDRVPVAGFAPDAEGFFWLAGQGGYGLQTAPAMSAVTEVEIVGGPWPAPLARWGVTSSELRPERLG